MICSDASLSAAVGIELFMAKVTKTWYFVPFPG